MKKFVHHLLLSLIRVVSIGLLGSNTKAQDTAPVPKLDSAALGDILEWLNTNAFPRARVGVKSFGITGPKSRFGIPRYSTSDSERIFSEGFHVESVNGCQVILSNEQQVTILDTHNYPYGKFQGIHRAKTG